VHEYTRLPIPQRDNSEQTDNDLTGTSEIDNLGINASSVAVLPRCHSCSSAPEREGRGTPAFERSNQSSGNRISGV
jgi:hypothetical protein